MDHDLLEPLEQPVSQRQRIYQALEELIIYRALRPGEVAGFLVYQALVGSFFGLGFLLVHDQIIGLLGRLAGPREEGEVRGAAERSGRPYGRRLTRTLVPDGTRIG